MTNTETTHGVSFDRLLAIAESDGMQVTWANDYAEPGYSENGNGIVFANWNDRTRWNPETKENKTVSTVPSRLCEIFERLGYEIEWEDEWLTCECGKAFRTSPDSYGWLMSGIICDGYCCCGECAKENASDYITEYVNDDNRAIVSDIFDDELEENWTRLDDISQELFEYEPYSLQSGFHPGQNDDGHKIGKKIAKHAPQVDYVYQVTGKGQFDVDFTVWFKTADLEDLEETQKRMLIADIIKRPDFASEDFDRLKRIVHLQVRMQGSIGAFTIRSFTIELPKLDTDSVEFFRLWQEQFGHNWEPLGGITKVEQVERGFVG